MRWLWPLLTLLTFAAAVALLAGNSTPPIPLQLVYSQQAPGFPTKQDARGVAHAGQHARDQAEDTSRPIANVPELSPFSLLRSSDDAAVQGQGEATEFWVVFGRRLKITDSLLAIFTGLLFVAAVWQGIELNRTVNHMEGASERQLRAYIHVNLGTGARVHPIHGRPLTTEVGVRNSGRTPAYDVVILSNAVCRPYPEPGEFPALVDDEAEGSKASIHSRQKVYHEIVGKPPLNGQDIMRMETEGWRPYIYGRITYRDIFRQQRTTNFRLVTNGEGVGHYGLAYTREGNESD